MDSPFVLLAVLNNLPESIEQILAEIADLRHGRSVSPFGGSGLISRLVRETDGQPGPLEPFRAKESCEQALQELIGLGFVKKDGSGYRLTYGGVIAIPEVVRMLKRKKYGRGKETPVPAPAPKADPLRPKPESPVRPRPIPRKRPDRDHFDWYAPRWKK